MINLKNYLDDGANYQARATLMYLQKEANIESSWNSKSKTYDAEIKVGRWSNFREQGYVVSLRNRDSSQINIAFFESRNSNNIHAIKWQQNSLDAINIDNALFGDNIDIAHSVGLGKAYEMSIWIINQLTIFWEESND